MDQIVKKQCLACDETKPITSFFRHMTGGEYKFKKVCKDCFNSGNPIKPENLYNPEFDYEILKYLANFGESTRGDISNHTGFINGSVAYRLTILEKAKFISASGTTKTRGKTVDLYKINYSGLTKIGLADKNRSHLKINPLDILMLLTPRIDEYGKYTKQSPSFNTKDAVWAWSQQ